MANHCAAMSLSRGVVRKNFETYRQRWFSSDLFVEACREIRAGLRNGKASRITKILSDDGQWLTAIMGIGPDACIPLHDHPGARGIVYLGEGQLTCRRFDVGERGAANRSAVLISRDERLMKPGDSVWFGRRYCNLHEFRSDADPALLFSVRQYDSDQATRSCYALLAPSPKIPNALHPALIIPCRPAEEPYPAA